MNKHNQNPQSGVNVSVFVTENSTNGVVGKPKMLANTVSDETGRFAMSFDRSNAINYEVSVDGDGIFSTSFNLAPEKVIEAKNFKENITVNVISYANVRLVNTDDEAQTTDELNISADEVLPCDCCPKSPTTYTGKVDTNFICKIPAGKFIVYNAVLRDKNGISVIRDSLLCTKLDTCTLVITY